MNANSNLADACVAFAKSKRWSVADLQSLPAEQGMPSHLFTKDGKAIYIETRRSPDGEIRRLRQKVAKQLRVGGNEVMTKGGSELVFFNAFKHRMLWASIEIANARIERESTLR